MTVQDAAVRGLDAVSIGTAIATLTGLLPPIASALSIFWLVLQIIEWFRKRRERRSQRRRSTD